MKLGFDLEQWRDIRRSAQDVEHSDLNLAIKSVFKLRMDAAFSTLTNVNSTELEIRSAQGHYNANKRGIMIIEDLIRMADSLGKQEKANAR